MTRSQKIFVTIAIIIAFVVIMAIVIINKSDNVEVAPLIQQPAQNNQMVEETKEIPAIQNEEKPELSSVEGKLSMIDISSVTIKDDTGAEMTFTVPVENAQFFKEVKKDEGVTLEEVGLLDIKTDTKVQVQFKSENKELVFMKILAEE